LDQLLRKILQISSSLRSKPCQYGIGEMGDAKIQATSEASDTRTCVAKGCCQSESATILALAVSRLDDKRRMNREAHVRFCESVAVKFRCATRPVAESFFHSIKTLMIHHCKFQNVAEAEQALFNYIEVYYNRQRKHSTNGYKSPAHFELEW
jgi:putative transposase